MKSVHQHSFAAVPRANVPRTAFDRSRRSLTTFNCGDLIPLQCEEILPGDTVRYNPRFFGRISTLINPLMHNLYLDVHSFFVPLRQVHANHEKLMGAQDNPGDSIDFTVPTMQGMTVQAGDLFDQFGLRPGTYAAGKVSSLPFRCYAHIWNQHYRDQNMQGSIPWDDGDGQDDPALYVVRQRGKRHDYFTSCLPAPQRGEPVNLPLGQTAPVFTPTNTLSDSVAVNHVDGNAYSLGTAGPILDVGPVDSTDPQVLYADLQSATATTVNAIRQAFQVQRMLERDARGGTRLQEVIMSHFNVVGPDLRLQRPEFLGGGTIPINISAIAQTSSTDSTTPQGNLSAMATVSGRAGSFTKSFTEFGYWITLGSVRADLLYQQGVPRHFLRKTRYDYYFPALAHIGEQAVTYAEIYWQDTASDNIVFGYQERNAELRYAPSTVHGLFRSDATAPLDSWHLAQEFANPPALDSNFISENPPMERVKAVTTEPDIILDCWHEVRHVRPMPLSGTPGFIDRF